MKGFPRTADELKDAGYVFENHAQCSVCGTAIEWYLTPNGKKVPVLLMRRGSDPVQVHFSHLCNSPGLFR